MARKTGLCCLAVVGFVAISAHAAQAAQVYPTFMAGLAATPNTNYVRGIVEGLKLQTTLSNPKLALTVFTPEDKYFDALATKLGIQPNPAAMTKNAGLMRQVLFYHFVTGSNGVRKVLPTTALQPGMKLDTMYISTTTKKPYQLAVAANQGKLQIKSVGTSAYIIKSNIKCGAGIAHVINNVLIPMPLSQIPKF